MQFLSCCRPMVVLHFFHSDLGVNVLGIHTQLCLMKVYMLQSNDDDDDGGGSL